MFDISDSRVAWIPIRWPGMKPNGDKLAEKVEFEVELLVELVDRETLRTTFPGSDERADMDEKERREGEVQGFLTLVKDWRKVTDKGEPLAFNEANALKLLGVPMFAGGFESSYLAAWTGQAEIREGNSAASSSAGRRGDQPKNSRGKRT